MSEKKIVQNGIGRGELNTIRDILMGQQISEYEERFSTLEKSFDLMKNELLKEVRALKMTNDSNNIKVKNEIMQKIGDLEVSLKKENFEIKEKMQTDNQKMNKKIAESFIEFGKKLLEDL